MTIIWRHELKRKRYPEAQELLVTADCGGSNGTTDHLATGTIASDTQNLAGGPHDGRVRLSVEPKHHIHT